MCILYLCLVKKCLADCPFQARRAHKSSLGIMDFAKLHCWVAYFLGIVGILIEACFLGYLLWDRDIVLNACTYSREYVDQVNRKNMDPMFYWLCFFLAFNVASLVAIYLYTWRRTGFVPEQAFVGIFLKICVLSVWVVMQNYISIIGEYGIVGILLVISCAEMALDALPIWYYGRQLGKYYDETVFFPRTRLPAFTDDMLEQIRSKDPRTLVNSIGLDLMGNNMSESTSMCGLCLATVYVVLEISWNDQMQWKWDVLCSFLLAFFTWLYSRHAGTGRYRCEMILYIYMFKRLVAWESDWSLIRLQWETVLGKTEKMFYVPWITLFLFNKFQSTQSWTTIICICLGSMSTGDIKDGFGVYFLAIFLYDVIWHTLKSFVIWSSLCPNNHTLKPEQKKLLYECHLSYMIHVLVGLKQEHKDVKSNNMEFANVFRCLLRVDKNAMSNIPAFFLTLDKLWVFLIHKGGTSPESMLFTIILISHFITPILLMESENCKLSMRMHFIRFCLAYKISTSSDDCNVVFVYLKTLEKNVSVESAVDPTQSVLDLSVDLSDGGNDMKSSRISTNAHETRKSSTKNKPGQGVRSKSGAGVANANSAQAPGGDQRATGKRKTQTHDNPPAKRIDTSQKNRIDLKAYFDSQITQLTAKT